MFRRAENGVARNFRSSSGGRRDSDERQRCAFESAALPDDLEIIERLTGVRGQCSDSFSGVDRAAAPKADDQITAVTRFFNASANDVKSRLGLDGEDRGSLCRRA